jgi:hypothetical protein
MNAGPDVERRISDWLAEQVPSRAPDRILPTAFEQTRHTRQRRFGAAWRSIPMNRTWQLATAAVVGILIIAVGAAFLGGSQSGVGGPPSATPPPTIAPTASPQPTPARIPSSGPIEAGTYLMSDGLSEFSVTFPAGWDAAESGHDIRKNRDLTTELAFTVFDPGISVYPDACANDVTPPLTGPTADDLLAALDAQQNSDVSEPADVTIGGRPAVRLEVSVPAGLDMATCYESILRIWADPVGYLAFGPPTGTGTIYVVETSSGRIVIGADGEEPQASAADLAELQAIVDSIQFEPGTAP